MYRLSAQLSFDDDSSDHEDFKEPLQTSLEHLEIEMLKGELDGEGVEEEDEANDDQPKEQLEEHKHSDGQMEIETTSPWKERDEPPNVRPVPLIQPRTTLNTNVKTSPYELFEKIIGNQLWSHLVEHTNEYAHNMLRTEEMATFLEQHPESRFHRWNNIGIPDIKKFIALMLSMALENRGSLEGNINLL